MTETRLNEGCDETLRSALQATRQNEQRWMEMSPEFSDDGQSMEQWTSIAKLRRLEVERIEALLAELSGPSSLPKLHVPPTGQNEENC